MPLSNSSGDSPPANRNGSPGVKPVKLRCRNNTQGRTRSGMTPAQRDSLLESPMKAGRRAIRPPQVEPTAVCLPAFTPPEARRRRHETIDDRVHPVHPRCRPCHAAAIGELAAAGRPFRIAEIRLAPSTAGTSELSTIVSRSTLTASMASRCVHSSCGSATQCRRAERGRSHHLRNGDRDRLRGRCPTTEPAE